MCSREILRNALKFVECYASDSKHVALLGTPLGHSTAPNGEAICTRPNHIHKNKDGSRLSITNVWYQPGETKVKE